MSELKVWCILIVVALVIESPGFYYAYKQYKRDKR